jgi:hypothetical protein
MPKTAIVIPRRLQRGISTIGCYYIFRFTKRSPVIPPGEEVFDSALRVKGLADILLLLPDPDIANMESIPP